MYRWINITPLNFAETHGDEIAEDLLELYRKGAIDCAAFSLTLVPEGTPVIDKAADYMRLYRIMKTKLQGKMPIGVLLQATMGHGWIPDSPTDFQKITKEDGTESYVFCPFGKPFRKYIADAVRTAALEHPDFFMLDDDTRLISGRGGCYCKLHLEEFGRRTGRTWTREDLTAVMNMDPDVTAQYDELLKDSILTHAKNIRKAIDSVDPGIPCLFCCCTGDVHHAPDIARALAAPGQELVVRINNARYLQDSPRSFAGWFHLTARQVAAFPEGFTLLAEPDTCPQNLYSTSCTVMNAQLTMSLLLGCKGGKIWITRLSTWEPGSGKNYRKLLTDNAKFYHALSGMKIRWTAPYIPVAEKPVSCITKLYRQPLSWSWIVSRMGIPFSFDKATDRTALLGGEDAGALSDAELKRILSGKVLMDGSAALELTRRGFEELIGCHAADWTKDGVTEEVFADGSTVSGNGNGIRADLSAVKNGAEVLSRCFHKAYALSDEKKELSPGTIRFKNSLGGEVVICGKSIELGGHFAPFVMFCENRKRFLINALNALAPLDLYIPEEAEFALMTGVCDSHRIFAVLNTGLDPVSPVFKGKWLEDFHGLEQLMPDGTWKAVETECNGKTMTIRRTFPALGTGVFRFQGK